MKSENEIITAISSIKTDEILEFLQSSTNIPLSHNALITVIKGIIKAEEDVHKRIVLNIFAAIHINDESFTIEAKNELKNNNLALDKMEFEELLSNHKDLMAEVSDENILFYYGDFLQYAYALGHFYVGNMIREVYSKIKINYLSPLEVKILHDCCKVYDFKPREAKDIYDSLTEYSALVELKGTNYDKALLSYFKFIFIQSCKSKNIDLNCIENLENDNVFINESADIGLEYAVILRKTLKIGATCRTVVEYGYVEDVDDGKSIFEDLYFIMY